MKRKGPVNPERSFGVTVGSVLVALAAFLLWRGRTAAAGILGSAGLVLLILGFTRPALLAWPSAIWWRFSLALGYVNARVLLTAMFVLVLVPVSMVWRLTGHDPLTRRRSAWPGWSPHPARYRDRAHYSRMY